MFVSVERVIDPRLRGRPVIVLSNNDGCAVSRSDEAKALGVAMGDPWFQLREKPHLVDLVACSSNYEEYGSFSSRFHETVASVAIASETYSVDEAFVRLPRSSPAAAAAPIQDRVRRWTGLPTAAGLGTTKTLAKVAQRHAKNLGVDLVDLTSWPQSEVLELLAATPTEDVWGIGNRLRAGLAGLGVHTALEPCPSRRRRPSATMVGHARTNRPRAGRSALHAGRLRTARSPAADVLTHARSDRLHPHRDA